MFLIDLLHQDRAVIYPQPIRPSSVQFDHLCDLISQLHPQFVIVLNHSLVPLLQGSELLIEGLELTLDLLHAVLIGIKEGDEGPFQSLQDGMSVDG